MEIFSRYWSFVRGIHRSPGNSPHKGQWPTALRFSLTCARISDSVNNREADYLRRHRAHYDVIVMKSHADVACPSMYMSNWRFYASAFSNTTRFNGLATAIPGSKYANNYKSKNNTKQGGHNMEKYSTLLTLCEGNQTVNSDFPELLCFLCCLRKQTVEDTWEMPVIWDSKELIWGHCNGKCSAKYLTFQWNNHCMPCL